MYNSMIFPATVDEFMEEYKVVDSEHVYSNGMEMVPIFRMKQWFEHEANHNAEVSKMEIIHCKDCNHYWKSKKWCICGRYVKETGFCDMADRKGEEDGTD